MEPPTSVRLGAPPIVGPDHSSRKVRPILPTARRAPFSTRVRFNWRCGLTGSTNRVIRSGSELRIEADAFRDLLRNSNSTRQVALRYDLGNHAADRARRCRGPRRLLRNRPSLLPEVLDFRESAGHVCGCCAAYAADPVSHGIAYPPP